MNSMDVLNNMNNDDLHECQSDSFDYFSDVIQEPDEINIQMTNIISNNEVSITNINKNINLYEDVVPCDDDKDIDKHSKTKEIEIISNTIPNTQNVEFNTSLNKEVEKETELEMEKNNDFLDISYVDKDDFNINTNMTNLYENEIDFQESLQKNYIKDETNENLSPRIQHEEEKKNNNYLNENEKIMSIDERIFSSFNNNGSKLIINEPLQENKLSKNESDLKINNETNFSTQNVPFNINGEQLCTKEESIDEFQDFGDFSSFKTSIDENPNLNNNDNTFQESNNMKNLSSDNDDGFNDFSTFRSWENSSMTKQQDDLSNVEMSKNNNNAQNPLKNDMKKSSFLDCCSNEEEQSFVRSMLSKVLDDNNHTEYPETISTTSLEEFLVQENESKSDVENELFKSFLKCCKNELKNINEKITVSKNSNYNKLNEMKSESRIIYETDTNGFSQYGTAKKILIESQQNAYINYPDNNNNNNNMQMDLIDNRVHIFSKKALTRVFMKKKNGAEKLDSSINDNALFYSKIYKEKIKYSDVINRSLSFTSYNLLLPEAINHLQKILFKEKLNQSMLEFAENAALNARATLNMQYSNQQNNKTSSIFSQFTSFTSGNNHVTNHLNGTNHISNTLNGFHSMKSLTPKSALASIKANISKLSSNTSFTSSSNNSTVDEIANDTSENEGNDTADEETDDNGEDDSAQIEQLN